VLRHGYSIYRLNVSQVCCVSHQLPRRTNCSPTTHYILVLKFIRIKNAAGVQIQVTKSKS